LLTDHFQVLCMGKHLPPFMNTLRLISLVCCLGSLTSCSLIKPIVKVPLGVLNMATNVVGNVVGKTVGRVGLGRLTDEEPQPEWAKEGQKDEDTKNATR